MAIIIKTFNDNNGYNLDLTAFTGVTFGNATFAKVTYIKSEDEFNPNTIIFHQVPTLTEIQNCLQTNVNRIQELAQNAIEDGDEEVYYDYIPYYIHELLFFIEGLHEYKLLTRKQITHYIKQLQNMDLDGLSLDSLETFIGSLNILTN